MRTTLIRFHSFQLSVGHRFDPRSCATQPILHLSFALDVLLFHAFACHTRTYARLQSIRSTARKLIPFTCNYSPKLDHLFDLWPFKMKKTSATCVETSLIVSTNFSLIFARWLFLVTISMLCCPNRNHLIAIVSIYCITFLCFLFHLSSSSASYCECVFYFMHSELRFVQMIVTDVVSLWNMIQQSCSFFKHLFLFSAFFLLLFISDRLSFRWLLSRNSVHQLTLSVFFFTQTIFFQLLLFICCPCSSSLHLPTFLAFHSGQPWAVRFDT